MAKKSSNIVNACCFWSVVISGIAILIGWILGWCNAGTQVVNIFNQIAYIVLMVGVVIGGLYYVQSVGGKYRWLWIVLFIIGVVVGILGIGIGFGWFHF